jgi:hypothetical protein
MAARTFGSLSPNCFTAAQLQALAEKDIQVEDIRGGGCTDPSLNTCERDARDLLDQYPVYDSTRGIYTEWGSIPFSWGSDVGEEWGSAQYVDGVGYGAGDRVLVISRDGLLVTLYVALADGPVPAGPFNPDLWSGVCHVSTTIPVGLPSYPELLELYVTYNPNVTHPIGTIVLNDSRCGNHTCAYMSNSVVPIDTRPPSSVWNLLYCVPNGKTDKCTKQIICGPGRLVTDLSSKDRDLVCVPVEGDQIL